MKEIILAVQRMQDYITSNIESEITMTDLSKVSNYSPWYSYRLFKNHTGLTPPDYIRKLRLTRSALSLKINNSKVIDVAFEQGFCSADGFTRAFFREFGCNPSEYSKKPIPISLFIPYGVKFKELRKEKIDMINLQNVFVQVFHKQVRKVIIKRAIKADDYFEYCENVGCDIWGLLTSMDSISGEPVCLWLPEHLIKPNTSKYVQGVEVNINYSGMIPEGFDIITLEASDYLMFQGEPFREEDYCEAIMAVQLSMDKYDPSLIGYIWDDSFPRIQLEPRGDRGYIELRAIKRSE